MPLPGAAEEGHDATVITTTARGAAIVVLLSLGLAACGDDDGGGSSPTTGATTSSSAPATTTTGAVTTTTTAGSVDSAVWPTAASATRYRDPVDAARGFATDYLGFVSPIVGAFQAGDSRSGEVEIRARAGGPATTALVRQVTADDTWWVLGAATGNIRITEPSALATITSPVRLRGESTAFEATVGVEIRQDDVAEPLVRNFVMGGSNGVMGPFDSTLAFPAPSSRSGAIVFSTESAESGNIEEAAVLRVHFAG